MPLPLPNLDDRRWQDLTQEAIPLIPRYAPQWTDFNTHDPGITLMEMYAWLSESLVYQLNQVPDRFTWKFLSFIGYPKRGPLPSQTVLAFQAHPARFARLKCPPEHSSPSPAHPIIFATERAARSYTGNAERFAGGYGNRRAARLFARYVGRTAGDGARDRPRSARRGPLSRLRNHSHRIARGVVAVVRRTRKRRRRTRTNHRGSRRAGSWVQTSAEPGWPCGGATTSSSDDCDCTPKAVPQHHSARVVWEAFMGGTWSALASVTMPARPSAGQVMDDTRSLTLDGLVEVNLPSTITQTALGHGRHAALLSARQTRDRRLRYDAPVVLAGVQANAVAAVQRTPLLQQLTIPGSGAAAAHSANARPADLFAVHPGGGPQHPNSRCPIPSRGWRARLHISQLCGAARGQRRARLRSSWRSPESAPPFPRNRSSFPARRCRIECIRLYTHDGIALGRMETGRGLPGLTAARISSIRSIPPLAWSPAATASAARCFRNRCAIVVTGFATAADSGNVPARQISGLATTPVNDVLLLGSLSAADQTLLSQIAANPVAATGGLPAAPLTELEGEAAAGGPRPRRHSGSRRKRPANHARSVAENRRAGTSGAVAGRQSARYRTDRARCPGDHSGACASLARHRSLAPRHSCNRCCHGRDSPGHAGRRAHAFAPASSPRSNATWTGVASSARESKSPRPLTSSSRLPPAFRRSLERVQRSCKQPSSPHSTPSSTR